MGKVCPVSRSVLVCLAAFTLLPWPAAALPVEATVEGPSAATPQQEQQADLRSMSLEELMNLEVTSVSKTSENLFKAPAAVYVITAEEIRLSGATNVPDLLRRAVGVDVMSMTAGQPDVSIRGFNRELNNKVLILV